MDLQRFPGQAENLLKSRMIHLVPEIEIRHTGTDQSFAQAQSLLEFIRDGETSQLKKLKISGEILHVTPAILAGAAMKLETLMTCLSRDQMEAIFIRIVATEDSRLRELVNWVPVNISSLDPEVVAGALIKLETVGPQLSYSLSAGHLTALFSRISQAPVLRLTRLDVFRKDLSLVPPEVLTGAIQKLEVVEFWWGKMTREQTTAILTLAKERRLGKIKNIRIYHVDGMRSVSPSLLQEARLNAKLKWID